MRRHPRRLLAVLAPVLTALVGAAPAACGPKTEPVPVLGGQPTASASAPSSAAAALSPLPSGLPPALPVPPMGVRGSTRGRLREDPTARCAAAQDGIGARPEDTLKKAVAACKLAGASAVFSGTVGDGEPHKEWPFRAKGGACYRVLSAREASLQDLVVILRDSKGDVAATGPESAVPAGAKVCFEADDDATVLVSAGVGRGGFAVQVVQAQP